MKLAGATVLAIFMATSALADITYLESSYGIEFDGCDYEKLINLRNGYVWECGEYGYRYHYGVLTVLQVNGNSMLCVGNVENAIDQFPNGDCYSGTLYNWN